MLNNIHCGLVHTHDIVFNCNSLDRFSVKGRLSAKHTASAVIYSYSWKRKMLLYVRVLVLARKLTLKFRHCILKGSNKFSTSFCRIINRKGKIRLYSFSLSSIRQWVQMTHYCKRIFLTYIICTWMVYPLHKCDNFFSH